MAKIVHVCESLAGGVLSVMSTLIAGQLKDGHEVVLIAALIRADTPNNWRESFPPGLEFEELTMVREISIFHDIKATICLRSMLRKIQPDVVHLHSSKAGALGRVASLFLGVNVIYQPHGWAFLRQDVSAHKRWFYLVAEHLLSIMPATIVACSEGERGAAISRRYVRRIEMVENAIPIEEVPIATHGLSSNRVGTCGRIAPQKDPGFFLKVAEALNDRVDFVWIGDGEADAREELQRHSVKVTGWRDKRDALKDISALSIYVQTSAWEGMPISVIEAMAAGLPVVATNIVGNRDLVVDGETGYLVSTPDEMVQRLSQLIACPDLMKRMGQLARKTALTKYSAANMVRRYYKIYGLTGPEASVAQSDLLQ